MTLCTVCGRENDSLHGHHVVQQADGGEKGPVVPLCGDCHTVVHKLARRMMKGDSGIRLIRHLDPVAREKITALAQVIVAGTNAGIDTDRALLTTQCTREQIRALDMFKLDRGFTNRQDAVSALLQTLVEYYIRPSVKTPEKSLPKRTLRDFHGSGQD